jgi:hypothetical protein
MRLRPILFRIIPADRYYLRVSTNKPLKFSEVLRTVTPANPVSGLIIGESFGGGPSNFQSRATSFNNARGLTNIPDSAYGILYHFSSDE